MSILFLQTELGNIGYYAKPVSLTEVKVEPRLVNDVSFFGKVLDKTVLQTVDGRFLSPEKKGNIPEITEILTHKIPYMDNIHHEIPEDQDYHAVKRAFKKAWQGKMMEFIEKLPVQNQAEILSGNQVAETLIGKGSYAGDAYINKEVAGKIIALISSSDTHTPLSQKTGLLSAAHMATVMEESGYGKEFLKVLQHVVEKTNPIRELKDTVGHILRSEEVFSRNHPQEMIDIIKKFDVPAQQEIFRRGFFALKGCAEQAVDVLGTFKQEDQIEMLNNLYLGCDQLIDGGAGPKILELVRKWPEAEQVRFVRWQAPRIEAAGSGNAIIAFVQAMPPETRERALREGKENVRDERGFAAFTRKVQSQKASVKPQSRWRGQYQAQPQSQWQSQTQTQDQDQHQSQSQKASVSASASASAESNPGVVPVKPTRTKHKEPGPEVV